MNLADVVVAVMFVGVTLYAVLGGADFGAGFWDLFAGSATRGAAQRALIERTIAPVWEANHVWLIFTLVVLWTGFPRAFAAIMSTLFIPFTAAAVGIILRGSGFAFRSAVTGTRLRRLFGATFALSSVLTPFFLGTVAGGVASGRIPVRRPGDTFTSWFNPTSVLGGTLAVAACAYLAATYLTRDAERTGSAVLADAFRRRALTMGAVAGILAALGIAVLHADAPVLFDGLTGRRGLPLVVASAVAGVASMVLVARRRYALARLAAAGAVAAVIWGWGAAQYPYLLVDSLTLDAGAGARATLVALVASLGVGAVLFGPPLVVLIVLAQRGRLQPDH